jgi:UDP-N-acetylmuramoyl-L-alanyl-D-glutamate--2,6-diaminopimelate ligase
VTPISKTLSELTADLIGCRLHGAGNPVITSIEYDSRRVLPGSLFVAMRGLNTDGTLFIRDALNRGAAAIACDTLPSAPLSVPVIEVTNARQALAEVSWAFFDHPEKKLVITGITGTNGKTTIASTLQWVLNSANRLAGLVGTLGISYSSISEENPRTTPESSDLAHHFADMLARGIAHVVMEATSIGVDLARTWQIPFQALIFTNLTRDHLDYHGSFEAYRTAKLQLFREQPRNGIALINRDDAAANDFIHAARGTVKTYGLHAGADYSATSLRLQHFGTNFEIVTPSDHYEISAPLIGRFNVYNLLAVIAAADGLGLPRTDIQAALRIAPPVRGRVEIVPSSAPFTVIVDYAHTPDALQQILTTLRALSPQRIITVVGAGGDRDRGKRPQMAEVACKQSDMLILTSDNPRNENPEIILDEMAAGLRAGSYLRHTDRRQAIETALQMAQAGDVILIAGKGHETYQEICGVKYPFDDREVALAELARVGFSS